jgi:hypothetical protein
MVRNGFVVLKLSPYFYGYYMQMWIVRVLPLGVLDGLLDFTWSLKYLVSNDGQVRLGLS